MAIAGGDALPVELWTIQRSYETRVYQSRDTFAKAVAEGRAWTPPDLRDDPGHSVRIGRYVLHGAAPEGDIDIDALTAALAEVEPPHPGWPDRSELRDRLDATTRSVLAMLGRYTSRP